MYNHARERLASSPPNGADMATLGGRPSGPWPAPSKEAVGGRKTGAPGGGSGGSRGCPWSAPNWRIRSAAESLVPRKLYL